MYICLYLTCYHRHVLLCLIHCLCLFGLGKLVSFLAWFFNGMLNRFSRRLLWGCPGILIWGARDGSSVFSGIFSAFFYVFIRIFVFFLIFISAIVRSLLFSFCFRFHFSLSFDCFMMCWLALLFSIFVTFWIVALLDLSRSHFLHIFRECPCHRLFVLVFLGSLVFYLWWNHLSLLV